MHNSIEKLNEIERFLKALDEYVIWKLDVARSLNEQEENKKSSSSKPHYILRDGDEDYPAVDGLRKRNDELFNAADHLLEFSQTVREHSADSLEPLNDFMNAFESFWDAVNQYRHYVLADILGLESVSGLKNYKTMLHELEIEMNRIARNGQPFSLALVRIDNFSNIKDHMSEVEVGNVIKTAVDIILGSMRPFDDAYYAGENEFFLCLRQTDVSGGLRAFERFEEALERLQKTYVIDGQKHLLTMSSCVCEPIADDDIETLLNNLRGDIEKEEKVHGTALEHRELSPVQHYAQRQGVTQHKDDEQ